MSKQYIGVDITTSGVRVVAIAAGKKPVVLGCKELLLETPSSKETIADPATVATLIRQALQQAAPIKIGTQPAITAIREAQVFRKVIELPVMTNEEDLSSAIKMEVLQYIPEDSGESELDFQSLGILPDGTTQQIMVVSVPKTIVAGYVETFANAKLPLKAIDVRAAALARAIVLPQEKKAIVIVDLEADITTISLYQGGVVRVTSSINIGVVESDSEAMDETKINALLLALVDEIDHVIKFYSNRTPGHTEIKEVRIAGLGPTMAELVKQLSQELEFPVLAAKSIVEAPAFCDSRFLAAIGCALYPLYT